MAKAPPPRTLPGDFFVVTYDHDEQSYTMFVDDESHSSYNLGSDIEQVMRYFRTTNATELGYKAIDLAKEFGAAQAIPKEDRVFKINSQQPRRGIEQRDMFANPGRQVFNFLP